MLLFQILVLFFTYSIYPIFGYPATYDYQELTREQVKRLDEWTEDSKQNKWELSGQFQGDMVLRPDQRNGIVNAAYRWPNNTIRYWMENGFSQQQQNYIINAIQRVTVHTCLKFEAANWNNPGASVVFRPSVLGCHSQVGYQGRANCVQYISLSPDPINQGCMTTGSIQHEFLHTIGFTHMENDSTRDDYVRIVTANVIEGKEIIKYNNASVSTFGEIYEYSSIMHSSPYASSKNGQPTIIPTNPVGAVIGQRNGVTWGDIRKINKMYNCP